MKNKRIIRSENVHKFYAGSTELSPFHSFYANEKTILRICAGRFFPHYNGENVTDAYWSLRRNAALFDVPERPIEISGPESVQFLNFMFTRDVEKLKSGRGLYVLACTQHGGIFMDGILFKLSKDRFWFVQPDGDMLTWLVAYKSNYNIQLSDPKSRALQIQGPASFKILHEASNGTITEKFKYFDSGFFRIGGQHVYTSRTGWTGELGYEIYTLKGQTDYRLLWQHLFNIGKNYGMTFSSMQAMNIRRIEAGIFDSGSDFNINTRPDEMGLEKFIDFKKKKFLGKQALNRINKQKTITGIMSKAVVPSKGETVCYGETEIGQVTTGAYSPFFNSGIGYLKLNTDLPPAGEELTLLSYTAGPTTCKSVDLPFYDRDKTLARSLVKQHKPWHNY